MRNRIKTELYLDGWVDVSGDVRAAEPLIIERGRKDEASSTQPSRLALLLNNRHGNYSQRNPLSPYYGVLTRNTPIRVSLTEFSDDFNREVSNSWGDSPDGSWGVGVGLGNTSSDDWQVGTTTVGGNEVPGDAENLCPNPSAAVDDTGWVSNLSVTHVSSGLQALGFERDTGCQITGDGTGEDWIVPAPGEATEGQDYSPSVAVHVDEEATVRLYILWLDESLNVIGFEQGDDFELDADAVTVLPITATAPEDAAWHTVQVTLLSSTATLTVSQCMMVEGGVPQPYKDGDSPGWGWTGTPGASTSVELISSGGTEVGGGLHFIDPGSGNAGYRLSYLSDLSIRDCDVTTTVTVPYTVTGGDMEPANIMFRGQSVTDYYMIRLVINPSQEVSVGIRHYDDTIIASQVNTGITHSPGQALKVRAQCEGETLRAKVWVADDPEPYEWTASGRSTKISSPGWVGIRSGLASSNSNDQPVVYAYSDFTVSRPRYFGEVASWPGRWDPSGNDSVIPIEASGVSRRLGQGGQSIGSAMRRGLIRNSDNPEDVIAYWPCEQGKLSQSISSAMPEGAPMRIRGGSPDWEAFDGFDCSDPLPVVKGTKWIGDVPVMPYTGSTQCRFLLAVPEDGEESGEDRTLFRFDTSGTVIAWSIYYHSGGALSLRAFDKPGNNILNSGVFAFGVNGKLLRVSIELSQSGSNVQWKLVTLEVGESVGSVISGTLSNRTINVPIRVFVNPEFAFQETAFGHIAVSTSISSIFDLDAQLRAYTGERAGERIQRLCEEEGIPFAYVGDLSDTVPMGIQRSATILDLLEECVVADGGSLYESRAYEGFVYRTRPYNQDPTVRLDYEQGHISPPFEPVEDDQYTANDVTVKREGGGEARAVLESGPMSIRPAREGGVGRYTDEATMNVERDSQLSDLAGWRLRLGTVDEARYPEINVNFRNPHVKDLTSALLDIDIDNRVEVLNPPAGLPPDDISQLVRGYRETLGSVGHTISLHCTPESPYQVLQVDDDDASRVDADTAVLAEGIDADDTTFTVSMDAPYFTTDSDDFPLYIRVSGEDIRVTEITGDSSPQTFTVERSVNGVVKAHKAGTPVVLSPAFHRTALSL